MALTAEQGGPETRTSEAVPVGRRSRAGAEAARYGVLRRLGPALKHDMVVNLQAIAMMAEVLNAKLERGGTPSAGELQASIAKLNRLAREAVADCLKVSSWIEPGEDQSVRLQPTTDESRARMIRSSRWSPNGRSRR